MKSTLLPLILLLIFVPPLLPGTIKGAPPVSGVEEPEYLEKGLILWREPITEMVFVWLAGGCFLMGQNSLEKQELLRDAGEDSYRRFYSDELPEHEVCLEGFWLGRHEVTQKQWLRLMDTNPFPPGRQANHPAENISWQLADDFSRRLSESSPGKFRLPTEAEWEYGARAGTRTPFSTGPTISTAQANYNGNHPYGRGGAKGIYRAGPLPVGSLPANSFGLFDLEGNLWEWCADWYTQDYYQHSPIKTPTGPPTGTQRVMRGGSWFTAARSLRTANRRGLNPAGATEDTGFRLVSLRPPPDLNNLLLDQNF